MNTSTLACRAAQYPSLSGSHPGPDAIPDEFDNTRNYDTGCYHDYSGGSSYIGAHFIG